MGEGAGLRGIYFFRLGSCGFFKLGVRGFFRLGSCGFFKLGVRGFFKLGSLMAIAAVFLGVGGSTDLATARSYEVTLLNITPHELRLEAVRPLAFWEVLPPPTIPPRASVTMKLGGTAVRSAGGFVYVDPALTPPRNTHWGLRLPRNTHWGLRFVNDVFSGERTIRLLRQPMAFGLQGEQIYNSGGLFHIKQTWVISLTRDHLDRDDSDGEDSLGSESSGFVGHDSADEGFIPEIESSSLSAGVRLLRKKDSSESDGTLVSE